VDYHRDGKWKKSRLCSSCVRKLERSMFSRVLKRDRIVMQGFDVFEEEGTR